MTKLFCDLKTDEEKSAFFLSGRGYETGVIAHAIQNDVAMAYHRCSEYRKELEALQAECEKLRADGREEWANQAVEAMQRARFAMEMNNWNWKSEASNDLKREAYRLIDEAIAASQPAQEVPE